MLLQFRRKQPPHSYNRKSVWQDVLFSILLSSLHQDPMLRCTTDSVMFFLVPSIQNSSVFGCCILLQTGCSQQIVALLLQMQLLLSKAGFSFHKQECSDIHLTHMTFAHFMHLAAHHPILVFQFIVYHAKKQNEDATNISIFHDRKQEVPPWQQVSF